MSEEEYNRLLKQFPDKLKGVLNWRKYFERLVGAGRKTGRSDIRIGDDVRKELKGEIDDRTIRRYLPESMKHIEHSSEESSGQSVRFTKKPDSNDKEINIPVKHTVKYVEPQEAVEKGIPQEHIKEFETGISEYKVILDCRKFQADLRIALLNKSKVSLLINNNEVVRMKEI